MADRTVMKERSAEDDILFSQLLRRPYEALLMNIHAELAAAGFADSYPSWGTNINQLEAAGYVERVPDPTDGRAKIIRFTQRGWEVRRVGDEIIASLEEGCARRLGERKMRQFKELMEDVSSVLEENRAQG
jgi:DNA-binding PadR family transcriptional regulator